MSSIIVGAGVFGLSIAWAIRKANPSTPVSILTYDHETAASYDKRKIIRDDYGNAKRMRQAIKVHQLWKDDLFFKRYYHPTGRVLMHHTPAFSRLKEIDESRSELGLPTRPRFDVKTVVEEFGSGSEKRDNALRFMQGVMSRCDEDDIIYSYNEDDGVVEWDKFMAELRQDLIQQGCKIQKAEVQKLVVHEGVVKSIQLVDEDALDVRDRRVFLAAGAWTTKILAQSDLRLPQPERIPEATGLFIFLLELDDSQQTAVAGTPAFSVYGANEAGEDGGEYLPQVNEDRIVKICVVDPFKNTPVGYSYSLPKDCSKDPLASKALGKARKFVKKYIPALLGSRIVGTRSLWDGVTNSQAPLIDKHPQTNNLIIVAGGSYHSAKDGPEIGDRSVKAADGDVDPDCAWEPSSSVIRKYHSHLMTDSDFQDLNQEAADNSEVQEIHSEESQYL
ncbi:hypothetical protein MMC25_005118 [Agyrium rufum]|nr:hypothetical protein [Agyrium rufum]